MSSVINGSRRWRQACLVVFYLAAIIYLVVEFFLSEVPQGIVGQPRGSELPAGWRPPIWLFGVAFAAVLLQWFARVEPCIGAAAYLFVLALLPVHKPPWVFVLWIQLPSLIAGGCLVTVLANAGKLQRRFGHWRRSLQFLVLLGAWYGILWAVRSVVDAAYRPALQFHPFRCLDVVALYWIATRSTDRTRSYWFVVGAILSGLTLRITLLQPKVLLDGDSAVWAVMSIAALVKPFCRPALVSLAPTVGAVGASLWLLAQTRNRGGLVGVLVLTFAMWVSSPRRLRWLLAMALPVTVVVGLLLGQTEYVERIKNLTGGSAITRVDTWRAGLMMMRDYPLTGVGPGVFTSYTGRYAPEQSRVTAHNVFIEVGAEAGIFALVLFAGFWLIAVVQGYRLWRKEKNSIGRVAFVTALAFLATGQFLSLNFFPLGYVMAGLMFAGRLAPAQPGIPAGSSAGIENA